MARHNEIFRADLFGHKCARCGQYWSSMAKPEFYQVITVLCPSCLSGLPLQAEPLSPRRIA